MDVRANGVAESSLEKGSEMWSLLEHLSFLVIDEISMAVISIMRKVHEKLCEIKGCPEDIPFAGIPILMMGDARQLAPVVSQATPSDVYFESIFNWDGFKNSQVFLMTNSVRQEGNSEFGKWVQDVGIGSAPIDELAPRAKPGSASDLLPVVTEDDEVPEAAPNAFDVVADEIVDQIDEQVPNAAGEFSQD